jgi:hypothetical protein
MGHLHFLSVLFLETLHAASGVQVAPSVRMNQFNFSVTERIFMKF